MEDILAESPSLAPRMPALFAKASREGSRLAAVETGLPESAFPAAEPFTVAQLRDPGFLTRAPTRAG